MQTKPDTLQGKIFLDIWGYSMTIVDYYIVLKETSKQVILAQLETEETATGFLSGTSVPKLFNGLKPEKTFRAKKKIGANGDLYLVSSLKGYGTRHWLKLWDGVPRSYNHCD